MSTRRITLDGEGRTLYVEWDYDRRPLTDTTAKAPVLIVAAYDETEDVELSPEQTEAALEEIARVIDPYDSLSLDG